MEANTSPLVPIKANLESRAQLSVRAKQVCSMNPGMKQTDPPCRRRLSEDKTHPQAPSREQSPHLN